MRESELQYQVRKMREERELKKFWEDALEFAMTTVEAAMVKNAKRSE